MPRTDRPLPPPLPTRRQRLVSLGLACWLGSLAPAWSQPVAPADFARQLLAQINRYRAQQQLAPLQLEASLAAIAADHSQAMARSGTLSHAGFGSRFDRTQRTACVENLAAGYRDADRLVEGWQASPKHHENLLDAQVQQVGIARVGDYVTWLACTPPMRAAMR